MHEVAQKRRSYLCALAIALGADEDSAKTITDTILATMHSVMNLPWDRVWEDQRDESVRNRIVAVGMHYPNAAHDELLAYRVGTRTICILQAHHPGCSNFRTFCNFIEDHLGHKTARRFVEALAQS